MRGNAARVLLPGLVVLGLVALVAIAASGSSSTGTSDSRPPADALLDSVLSLVLLLLAIAAAVVVYGLSQRKEIAREAARGRYRRLSYMGFVLLMLAFSRFAFFRLRNWNHPEFVDVRGELAVPGVSGPTSPVPGGGETRYDPEVTWIPILVVVGLAAVGVAAWFVASRGRRVERRDKRAAAEAVAALLDDTLDDLRAEKDPRKAVIAAYARLERVLAAHGMGRNAAEAPVEYLNRILPRLEVERGSVRRLTGLFTRAKFSPHDVDTGMKEQAIEALSTVRDELRAADEHRRDQRLAAFDAPVELSS
jgi:hypothetical protein